MGTSKNIDEVRRRLSFMIRSASAVTFSAKVVSVDSKMRTCSVDDDGVIYDDVLLYAVADDSLKGLTAYPAVGSTVLVSRIAGSNMLFVALCSQIDKIDVTIGEKCSVEIDEQGATYTNDKVSISVKDNKVEIEADEVVFNGGNNDGMVIHGNLQEKLNQLTAYLGVMNKAIEGGFTAIGAGPNANGPAGQSFYSGLMSSQTLDVALDKNTKLKH